MPWVNKSLSFLLDHGCSRLFIGCIANGGLCAAKRTACVSFKCYFWVLSLEITTLLLPRLSEQSWTPMAKQKNKWYISLNENENLQVWLLSMSGIGLPRSAFVTLQCFWLHISTIQHQDATMVTQPNVIAICFATKSISRQRRIRNWPGRSRWGGRRVKCAADHGFCHCRIYGLTEKVSEVLPNLIHKNNLQCDDVVLFFFRP